MTHLTLGLAQLAPVWLDRAATLDKVLATTEDAACQGADLLVFSEALVPGYPFWLELTDGARFNDDVQKELFALYSREAVDTDAGHLDGLCQLAREHGMMIVLGCIERAADRSGHSLYCAAVTIDARGELASIHRKLVPTFEERLAWAPGDGHGLRVHPCGPFTVGTLNCWENWMPLARAAFHAQGEDLHLALWPGQLRNTEDITPFLAKEGRSYVASSSGVLRPEDIPEDFPQRERILEQRPGFLGNGGSCLCAPDGSFVLEPLVGEEGLRVAELDPELVRRERQNFDPAGHYSRPDVLELRVNRKRQAIARFED